MSGFVRCSFYERVPHSDKLFRYNSLQLRTHDTYLPLFHPPMVGDLVYLPGFAGGYRVIARDWMYSAYGSVDWPRGQSAPLKGPLMQVVVTASDGLFRDEAPLEPHEIDRDDES